MTEIEKASATFPKGAMTPLWVISLFLALTEVMTGIAVLRANGGVQIALTWFVIAFPSAVTCAFFGTLWLRPYVFYPPSEFGASIDPAKYVEAMRISQISESKVRAVIEESIKSTLASPAIVEKFAAIGASSDEQTRLELERLRVELAHKAVNEVEQNFISIDTQNLTGRKSPTVFAYDPEMTVSQFLDQAYFALDGAVPPYQYAAKWLLRDQTTSHKFTEIGTLWARRSGRHSDTRTLSDIGIMGGAKLEVIPTRNAA